MSETIGEAVKREALEAGQSRHIARTMSRVRYANKLDAGHARAVFSGADLQALAVEMPADAVRAMQLRWPGVWSAVRESAAAFGDRPIPAMVRLIEAGLAAEAAKSSEISNGKDEADDR